MQNPRTRTIVVTPGEEDLSPSGLTYFRNFLWRLQDAIRRDGLDPVDIRVSMGASHFERLARMMDEPVFRA